MPSARRLGCFPASAASTIPADCYHVIPRNTVVGGGVAARSRHNAQARSVGGQQALTGRKPGRANGPSGPRYAPAGCCSGAARPIEQSGQERRGFNSPPTCEGRSGSNA